MKKMFYILLALAVLAGGVYFAVRINNSRTGGILDGRYTTFQKSELGFQFDYPEGADGYALEEILPTEPSSPLLRTFLLIRTEDKMSPAPVGGEGSPVIAIQVFDNPKKQKPMAWAEENVQFSNINLKLSEPSESSVGGANAIRYMADGLYASDNAVVAHGENVYVITGQFLDVDSDLRRDFPVILESVRFIPKPGQS